MDAGRHSDIQYGRMTVASIHKQVMPIFSMNIGQCTVSVSLDIYFCMKY